MAEENIVTKDQLKNLSSIANNYLAKATEEEIFNSTNIKQLISSAQNFIKVYQMNKVKLQKLVNSEGKIISKDKKIKEEGNNLLREIYSSGFKFDEHFNKFLYGDSYPKVGTYIYESKRTGLSSYDIPLQEMAKRAVFEGFSKDNLIGRIKFNKSVLDELSNSLSIEDKLEKEEEKDKLKIARAAYAGARARLETFYERRYQMQSRKAMVEGKEKPKRNRQGGYLLWKEGARWSGMIVSNYGDLKEAYLSLLMNEHILTQFKDINIGSPKYYSHELIQIFATDYVAKVDNAATLFEEDVVTNNLQRAVKSGYARLPSLEPIIDAANKIIQNKDRIAKDTREAIIEELYQKHSQGFERGINKTVSAEMTEVIKEVKKILNKSVK